MRAGRRLGVDPGDARIGVASCDPSGLIATPLETVPAGREALARLAALAAENDVVEVVVGLPVSMSGGEGPAAGKVREMATSLADLVTPLPVRLCDERLSTVTAQAALRARGTRGKRQRAVVDQTAAVVILQHALDSERASGRAPGEVVETTGGRS